MEPDLDTLTWRPDLTSRDVTRERLDAIAFTPMSARLRNELITLAYGDLAQAMAGLLGTTDATWATFGQWASTTVGGYLTVPVPVLGTLIGQAFGDGNRDVFADIGRAHTTFLDTVGRAHADGGDLAAAWQTCEERLKKRLFSPPGGPLDATAEGFWRDTLDPRTRPDGPRYNQLLVIGFRSYYHALLTEDAEQRSRSILLGNCLIGLHEQRLLARAISAGFRSWLRTLLAPWRLLLPRARWLAHPPGELQLRVESWWIRFATRHLIGVRMPWTTVRIGRPVPIGEHPVLVGDLPVGGDERPIVSLPDHEILGQAFERFAVNTGPAGCWNDLRDRMGFIMALFAQQQRTPGWFDPDGAVVRPPRWTEFEPRLAELLDLVHNDPGPPPAAVPVPSPLTEDDLDRLRRRPSFLPLDGDLDDLAHIDFDAVSDERRRRLFRGLRDDVAHRLAAVSAPGDLLDPRICRAARTLFARWSTIWFMGLVFRSLPDSYAAAAGVRVLGQVSDLATDPFRRAGETAQFVLDLLGRDEGWGPQGMLPDGDAYRSVAGVRAMHAIVANRLTVQGWDEDTYGPPLNAEDVLGTALTFGISPLQMLDSLGLEVDTERRNSWVRFWLGIGHLLGAPYESVTAPTASGRVALDHLQAQALAQAIWARHHARSLDGVRLGEAILAGVTDGFPRWAGWLPAGLMQVLGQPRVVGLLLLGRGESDVLARMVATAFRMVLNHRTTRPLGRVVVRVLGRLWVRPFLRQGRTRPYRRPFRDGDRSRAAWSQAVAKAWPLSCSRHAAP